jgi:hypothetical protein
MDKTMFFPFKVIIIPDLTRKNGMLPAKNKLRFWWLGPVGTYPMIPRGFP